MKLGLAYASVGGSSVLAIIHWLGPTAQGIVLAAAALGALVYLWRNAVTPTAHFFRRVARGVDLLFELADWRREVDKRLDSIEAKTEADVSVAHYVRDERRKAS